jgi:hypothetical protein
MKGDQTPDRKAVVDLVVAESQRKQLEPRDDPVLTPCELRNRRIPRTRATFAGTIAANSTGMAHSADLRVESVTAPFAR